MNQWFWRALGVLAVVAGVAVVVLRRKGGLAGVTMVLSPHRGTHGKKPVRYGVVHFTAGATAAGAVKWFEDPASRASAHFVFAPDGGVTQCVPLDESAWHVGTGVIGNGGSVGFELVNVGRCYRNASGGWECELGPDRKRVPYKGPEPREAGLWWPSGHEVRGWWAPYPEAQLAAFERVLLDVERKLGRKLELVGHEDIATPEGRKVDPGPLFPWARFGRKSSLRQTRVT